MSPALCRVGALVAASLWAVAFSPSAGRAQDPFRLEREALVVDAPEHWRQWQAPVASLDEADTTILRPRLLRRGINASLNAHEFTVVAGHDTAHGGISAAGSRLERARLVMDGDPTTGWEPDPATPLDRWYVEVDLGRDVIARQVVVRFGPPEAGDPFLKFRVLLSNGTVTDDAGRYRGLRYFRAGQVASRNKHQYTFTFDVATQLNAPADFTGEVARFVRFEALGSDTTRAEAVGRERWEALGPDDRGAVAYYRQTAAGRLVEVDSLAYAALAPHFRGPVRYWRRERPLLAEIEVLTPGDNIVVTTQRALRYNSQAFSQIVHALATDGIYSSYYPMRLYDPVRHDNQVIVDLGARYWLDRLLLLTPELPLRAYQVLVSDASLDPSGHLVWSSLGERLNPYAHLHLEERFEPRPVRYLQVRRLALGGDEMEDAAVSEIQAYGEGYLPDVTVTSPVLRLPGSRMFTGVWWDADTPYGTALDIRTRSGDQIVQVRHYYNRWGGEVSQEEWRALGYRGQGDLVVEDLPAGDWSTWSAVYTEPGQAFASPSPRRMLQVQLRFRTADPLRSAALRSLRFGLSAPLVTRALAEVWPAEEVPAGADQDFVLHLWPQFEAGDTGFDRLRLTSSSTADIHLVSAAYGAPSVLAAGLGTALWPGPAQVRQLDEGGLDLVLPRAVESTTAVYELRFRTRVYLNGTRFDAALLNATQPGVVQQAAPGDASTHLASSSLVVQARAPGGDLMGRLRAVPAVFSPNGDGINDRSELQFPVYLIKGGRTFEVRVFDLAGSPVRDLSAWRQLPSGLHAFPWDGRDNAGQFVPPGVYVARIAFPTDFDAAGTTAVTTVGVAY